MQENDQIKKKMGNLGLCVLWPVRWNAGLDREKPVVLMGAGPAAAGGGGTNGQTQSQTIHYFHNNSSKLCVDFNK